MNRVFGNSVILVIVQDSESGSTAADLTATPSTSEVPGFTCESLGDDSVDGEAAPNEEAAPSEEAAVPH